MIKEYTLKELDELLQQPKGFAFRLFKSNLDHLTENRDFRVLDHREQREEIARLRHDERIYAQSVNVVLLSEDCFQQLRQLAENNPAN